MRILPVRSVLWSGDNCYSKPTGSTRCTWLNQDWNNQTVGTEVSFWNIELSNRTLTIMEPECSSALKFLGFPERSNSMQKKRHFPMPSNWNMSPNWYLTRNDEKSNLHFIYLLHLSKMSLRTHTSGNSSCDVTKGEATSPIPLQG